MVYIKLAGIKLYRSATVKFVEHFGFFTIFYFTLSIESFGSTSSVIVFPEIVLTKIYIFKQSLKYKVYTKVFLKTFIINTGKLVNFYF